MVFNNPVYFVDPFGLDNESFIDRTIPGVVHNNSSNPVSILQGRSGDNGQGTYRAVPGGESSKQNIFNPDDVDGVWVNGKFYAVKAGSIVIIAKNGCVIGGTLWNGDPDSPNSPVNRGAPNNNTPTIP